MVGKLVGYYMFYFCARNFDSAVILVMSISISFVVTSVVVPVSHQIGGTVMQSQRTEDRKTRKKQEMRIPCIVLRDP